uniref:hypothetical protein n=1 Tax=Desertihabitans aurantiacus TaxID=2282477 RepID=UPI0018E4E089
MAAQPPDPPTPVLEAVDRLGLDAATLRPTLGRSGLTWYCGGDVLRLVPAARAEAELAARDAAGRRLPV